MSVQIVPEGTVRLGVVESTRAHVAVLAAGLLTRMAPEKLNNALTRLNGSRPQASENDCARARAAVCTVSLKCRGPKGCLRRSVATLLLCRMGNKSATWCTGFALAPFRAHAWVEVDGKPVSEHDEVSDYIVVLSTSPARAQGQSIE